MSQRDVLESMWMLLREACASGPGLLVDERDLPEPPDPCMFEGEELAERQREWADAVRCDYAYATNADELAEFLESDVGWSDRMGEVILDGLAS